MIKLNINIIVLLIYLSYITGIVGYSITYTKDLFLSLTPLHLLFSFFLIIISHNENKKDLFRVFIPIYLYGFLIELIGTNTGYIFGEYSYGDTLGLKILETPIIMGINWLILIYSSYSLVISIKNKYIRIVLASLIMLLLDFIIEPIAVKFDFWYWQEEFVPMQNYIAWFISSLPAHYYINNLSFIVNRKVGINLLIAQLIFFVFLILIHS